MDELIKKVKMGDQESATILVRMFYNEIYLYVLKLTMNKDLSYDLTQEIFIRGLKKIHTYKMKNGNIKNWFFKIAYNYVMTYYKLTKNEKFTVETFDYLPANIDIEDDAIKKENRLNLIKHINKLEKNYREIIIFRYYQDLPIHEVAYILNLNENTVKTRTRKALELLKISLEEDKFNEKE